MARTPALVVLNLAVPGIAESSGPLKAQVHREPMKEVLDQVRLGMPEKLALAKFDRPPATSGDGCGSPDWRWYQFAEWFAGDYRIEVRFRHGRVVHKLIEARSE